MGPCCPLCCPLGAASPDISRRMTSAGGGAVLLRSAYEISTCVVMRDGKMSAMESVSYRLISVRSVVQLYPGPLFELTAPPGVVRPAGLFFSCRTCSVPRALDGLLGQRGRVPAADLVMLAPPPNGGLLKIDIRPAQKPDGLDTVTSLVCHKEC
jgi:hypothetical protein